MMLLITLGSLILIIGGVIATIYYAKKHKKVVSSTPPMSPQETEKAKSVLTEFLKTSGMISKTTMTTFVVSTQIPTIELQKESIETTIPATEEMQNITQAVDVPVAVDVPELPPTTPASMTNEPTVEEFNDASEE